MRSSSSTVLLGCTLTLLCACAPPSVVVTVEDPFGLAEDADALVVNDVSPSPLDGAEFPLRLTLTAPEEVDGQRVTVAALRGGVIVARGATRVDFTRDGSSTGAISIGAPCELSAQGAACNLDESGATGLCIDGACLLTRCGDGFVDEASGEGCDDGNASDNDDCTNTCVPNRCGDGLFNPGVEACDDGNPDDTDACTNNCVVARCGDGIVQAGVEACDDGNNIDADACRADCTANFCGDGVLDPVLEECDDGVSADAGPASFDGCSATCRFTVWTAQVGAPAPGFELISNDELLTELESVQAGTIGVDPTSLLVATAAGAVVNLDARSGAQNWSYDPGAPIIGRAGFNGVYWGFAASDGRLHFVLDGIGTTFDLPGGALAASPMIPAAFPPSQATAGYPFVVIGSDAAVYLVAAPGGCDPEPGPCVVQTQLATAGFTPCPGGACSPWYVIPGFLVVPALGELIIARTNGCADFFRYPLDDPDEHIVGSVAFLGDNSESFNFADLAIGVTNLGRAYRFPVPELPNVVMDPAVCNILPPPGPPVRLLDDAATGEPIIAPLSIYTVVLPSSEGALLKQSGAVNFTPEFTSLWADPSVSVPYTPALDAEGFLYFGDDAARLHKVHLVSGVEELELQLPANVHGSPLIAGRGIYVLLDDGTVHALERGGSRVPRYGAWHRAGGGSDGVSAAACGAVGASPTLALLLGLGLLARRRAGRARRSGLRRGSWRSVTGPI